MTRTFIVPGLSTRVSLVLAAGLVTSGLAFAQPSVQPPPSAAPPRPPAPARPAAQAEPPAPPMPPARPVPSRNMTIAVTVTPVAGTAPGTPRLLSVTTADGRYAQVRRQGSPGNNADFFLLDVTATMVNDRQVLVEFKLQANANDQPDPKSNVGIAQEGAVLLTPGVRQRVTELDDSGGRPSVHVDMQVDLLR